MRIALLRFLVGLTPVMLYASPIFADAQKPAASGGMFGGNFIFIMLAMFLIIYFMMIRPEQRKQKARQKLLAALKKGDKVITAAGIFGTVHSVKEGTVMVKIAENTVVEFAKGHIQAVTNTDGSEKTDQQDDKAEKDEKEKK
jgi:preprotein translocase subunit YajC